jgi:hypothetical protein
MPEEAAVIEAPAITDGGADTGAVDTEVDLGAADTGAENVDTGQDEGGEGDYDTASKLWRDVKASTHAGKPLTPQQLKAINRSIHAAENYKKRLPDGLEAVESRLQALAQLSDDETAPIENVINETIQERNYFRELDDLFTRGDAGFVERMVDANPDAFQNIVPSVLSKYAQLNPDGYSAYVSQAVVAHMTAAEVPLQFRILQTFLPQLPEGPARDQVIAAFESVYQWTQALNGMAQKKIEPKKLANAQVQDAPGKDDLQMREMKITAKEWNSETLSSAIATVNSEAAKAAGKSKLSEKEMKTVVAKVGEELDARLSANSDYAKAMQGYLKNGNKGAYTGRLQSERKKLIPGAVRRAVDDVIAGRPKAQPLQQGGVKQAPAQQNGQPAKPLQGAQTDFVMISGHPKTVGLNIDRIRTSQRMLLNKTAYIKGESKPRKWK